MNVYDHFEHVARVDADSELYAKALGETLRALREERGIAQDTLATLAGMSSVTLYHLEKGRSKAELKSVYRVLATLGVKPGDFYASVDRRFEARKDAQGVAA